MEPLDQLTGITGILANVGKALMEPEDRLQRMTIRIDDLQREVDDVALAIHALNKERADKSKKRVTSVEEKASLFMLRWFPILLSG